MPRATPSRSHLSPKPANRLNILKALYFLRDNDDVKHGDHILFYFAGHGTQYGVPIFEPSDAGSVESSLDDVDATDQSSVMEDSSPTIPPHASDAIATLDLEAAEPEDTISPSAVGSDVSTTPVNYNDPNYVWVEALCPADAGWRHESGTLCCITDKELSLFVEQLRDKKGKNITLILDCCHSGGANRAAAFSGPGAPRRIYPQVLPSPSFLISAADVSVRAALQLRETPTCQ